MIAVEFQGELNIVQGNPPGHVSLGGLGQAVAAIDKFGAGLTIIVLLLAGMPTAAIGFKILLKNEVAHQVG